MSKKKNFGFTLIELLIVIGILAVLMTAVIIAINPSRQLSQGNDAKRRSDVNAILNAVYQYATENQGLLPDSISTTQTEICKTSVATTTCTTNSLINLKMLSYDEKYIVEMPADPIGASTYGVGYEIYKSANGRKRSLPPILKLDKQLKSPDKFHQKIKQKSSGNSLATATFLESI